MTDLEVARYALRTFDLHAEWGVRFEMVPGEVRPRWSGGTARRLPDRRVLSPLGSANPYAWQDGTCTAQCLRHEYGLTRWTAKTGMVPAPMSHTAPHKSCSCGIYGSLSYANLYVQYPSEVAKICAVIAVEGTTIIGTRGLRTQYARVVAWNGYGYHADVARKQFAEAREFGLLHYMLDEYDIPVGSPDYSDSVGSGYWRA